MGRYCCQTQRQPHTPLAPSREDQPPQPSPIPTDPCGDAAAERARGAAAPTPRWQRDRPARGTRVPGRGHGPPRPSRPSPLAQRAAAAAAPPPPPTWAPRRARRGGAGSSPRSARGGCSTITMGAARRGGTAVRGRSQPPPARPLPGHGGPHPRGLAPAQPDISPAPGTAEPEGTRGAPTPTPSGTGPGKRGRGATKAPGRRAPSSRRAVLEGSEGSERRDATLRASSPPPPRLPPCSVSLLPAAEARRPRLFPAPSPPPAAASRARSRRLTAQRRRCRNGRAGLGTGAGQREGGGAGVPRTGPSRNRPDRAEPDRIGPNRTAARERRHQPRAEATPV